MGVQWELAGFTSASNFARTLLAVFDAGVDFAPRIGSLREVRAQVAQDAENQWGIAENTFAEMRVARGRSKALANHARAMAAASVEACRLDDTVSRLDGLIAAREAQEREEGED